MIRFFKSPQPAALIVIPFIVLILWGQRAMNMPVSHDETVMPLWGLIAGFMEAMPSFLRFLIFGGMISLQAIYLLFAFALFRPGDFGIGNISGNSPCPCC